MLVRYQATAIANGIFQRSYSLICIKLNSNSLAIMCLDYQIDRFGSFGFIFRLVQKFNALHHDFVQIQVRHDIAKALDLLFIVVEQFMLLLICNCLELVPNQGEGGFNVLHRHVLMKALSDEHSAEVELGKATFLFFTISERNQVLYRSHHSRQVVTHFV